MYSGIQTAVAIAIAIAIAITVAVVANVSFCILGRELTDLSCIKQLYDISKHF